MDMEVVEASSVVSGLGQEDLSIYVSSGGENDHT